MSPLVVLKITSGPLYGQEFQLSDHDSFLVGRRGYCHAQIQDASVSRHHCIVEVNGTAMALRDLGSRHGTYVNGRRYGGRDEPGVRLSADTVVAKLQHGDRVRVGTTELMVYVIGAPTEDAAGVPPTLGLTPSETNERASEHAGNPPGEWFAHAGHLVRMARETGDELMSADRFPGYTLESVLGRGGMGTVYRARRASDGRHVALKTMNVRSALDDISRRRFLREMRISGHLRHPNVVECFESVAQGFDLYLVMECCEGGSLADLAARSGGKIPAPSLIPLLHHSLAGLRAAHEAGIVHRDLKPTNILLAGNEANPIAKIADLGLAKAFDDAGASEMTLTAQLGGTVRFMPPEQIANFKQHRPVSDLWSLAAAFYFMLVGDYALNFSDDRDDLEVVLSDSPIPVRERDPHVPERLARVLDRALSADPFKRYVDAASMAAALDSDS